MSIPTMPNDVILLIGQQSQSQADLHALVRTSRRFYLLLKHLLYQHNLNYHDGDGILQAAKLGSIPAVAQFIKEGYPVKDRPFHEGEHPQVSGFTIPSPCTCYMEHPILYAAEYGHTELVRYLLVSCPESEEFKNNLGETPLHLAVRNGSLSVIKALLNEGWAKVSMLDTNFTLAPIKEAAVNGHTHVVEYLLSDTLNKHDYASSLLPFAAASGNIALVSMLLDLGAQINHKYVERHAPRKALNSRGQGYESTALSVAVSYGDVTMVNHLLSHGADVNLQTGSRTRGRAPLYMALEKNDNEVGKVLLAHGADIDDEHVREAIYQRNKIALKMLLAKHEMHECPINLLDVAAATEDTDVFQILLDAGFNEEAALLEAINRGQEEIVTLLLAHGTDHDLPSLCKSAVGVVIANRDVGLMRVLLRYGAHAYPEDLEAARLFAPEHIVKLAEKFPLHSRRKRDMYPGPFVAYNASQEGWLSVDQDWGSTRRRLW
ncbi:hypothetical protein PEBR_37862 [Penicillium brasilianum]|uniref:Uncharacterized protein n=1 Tax=Penicillium brasilianum TaxID=104259 RepID=A0A1S9RB95_PENBI|nr:hypothetical protein PEBR_37862 [Penicillium brasilianum]